MLARKNLELERGRDAVFEIPLGQPGSSMDISAENSVQVDVYRLGAFEDEAPVFSCTESNGRIAKVTTTGETVTFRWKVPKEVSATLLRGDYFWRETDMSGGLETESIGGVLTVT